MRKSCCSCVKLAALSLDPQQQPAALPQSPMPPTQHLRAPTAPRHPHALQMAPPPRAPLLPHPKPVPNSLRRTPPTSSLSTRPGAKTTSLPPRTPPHAAISSSARARTTRPSVRPHLCPSPLRMPSLTTSSSPPSPTPIARNTPALVGQYLYCTILECTEFMSISSCLALEYQCTARSRRWTRWIQVSLYSVTCFHVCHTVLRHAFLTAFVTVFNQLILCCPSLDFYICKPSSFWFFFLADAPLPPQASTVPKKRGPAEQAVSPRAVPPLEPSLMSTPIAATSGAGAYSGVANVPASPFMSLPPQTSSGAFGFGAGVSGMSGRFPRAVPRAKQPSPTAASAATVTPAPGISRRLLRFLWRQVRKHTFLTLGVALIAILVVGILSAPATPGLGACIAKRLRKPYSYNIV